MKNKCKMGVVLFLLLISQISQIFNQNQGISHSNADLLSPRISDTNEFFDGFESNAVDAYPAGWTTEYGGSSIKCVASPVYQGSRALLMKGGQSWVAEIYNTNIDDISGNFSLECAFYRPTPGLADENSGGITYKGIGVNFDYASSLVKVSRSGQSVTGLSVNTWHTLRINYTWATQLEAVYIDGTYRFSLTAAPVLSGEGGGNRVWLSSGNDGRSGALREAYYDNINLTRLNSTRPAPPNLQVITPNPDHDGDINITWEASTLADSYKVYRDTHTISTLLGDEVLVNTTTFTTTQDLNRPNGTYYYVVTGVNENGEGGISQCRSVVVSLISPAAPLLGEILPEIDLDGVINLDWNDVTGAVSYRIYRNTSYISQIGTLAPIGTSTTSSYQDCLYHNGLYYYAIIATNDSGDSGLSNSEDVEIMTDKVMEVWNNSDPGWIQLADRNGYGYPSSGYGWGSSTGEGGDGGQYWGKQASDGTRGVRWKHLVNLGNFGSNPVQSIQLTSYISSWMISCESSEHCHYNLRIVDPSSDAVFYTIASRTHTGGTTSETITSTDEGARNWINSHLRDNTIYFEIAIEITVSIIIFDWDTVVPNIPSYNFTMNLNDTQAPAVTILEPAAGVVSGNVNLALRVVDTHPPLEGNVKAFINASTPLEIPLTKSSDFLWDGLWDNSTEYPNGDYNLSFWAQDSSPNANLNNSKFVIVTLQNPDILAPMVTITNPTPLSTVSGLITINLTVIDANPPTAGTVNVNINASEVLCLNLVNYAGNNWSVDWDTLDKYPNGWYNLSFTAMDSSPQANVNDSEFVIVYLDNLEDSTPPEVSFLSPTTSLQIGKIYLDVLLTDANQPLPGNVLAQVNASLPFNLSLTYQGANRWAAWWTNLSVYLEADYNISIWAKDSSMYENLNDWVFVIVSIVHDSTNPAIGTPYIPWTKVYDGNPVRVWVPVVEANIDTVTLTHNAGGSWANITMSPGLWDYWYADLLGTYVPDEVFFQVHVNDTSENSAESDLRSFLVQRVTISFHSPANESIVVGDTLVEISINVPNGDMIKPPTLYLLNEALDLVTSAPITYNTGTGYYTTTLLTADAVDGTYYFQVRFFFEGWQASTFGNLQLIFNNGRTAFNPTLVVDQVEAEQGASITIDGTGFYPGENVSVFFDDYDLMHTFQIGTEGCFSLQLTLPSEEAYIGAHLIDANSTHFARDFIADRSFTILQGDDQAPMIVFDPVTNHTLVNLDNAREVWMPLNFSVTDNVDPVEILHAFINITAHSMDGRTYYTVPSTGILLIDGNFSALVKLSGTVNLQYINITCWDVHHNFGNVIWYVRVQPVNFRLDHLGLAQFPGNSGDSCIIAVQLDNDLEEELIAVSANGLISYYFDLSDPTPQNLTTSKTIRLSSISLNSQLQLPYQSPDYQFILAAVTSDNQILFLLSNGIDLTYVNRTPPEVGSYQINKLHLGDVQGNLAPELLLSTSNTIFCFQLQYLSPSNSVRIEKPFSRHLSPGPVENHPIHDYAIGYLGNDHVIVVTWGGSVGVYYIQNNWNTLETCSTGGYRFIPSFQFRDARLFLVPTSMGSQELLMLLAWNTEGADDFYIAMRRIQYGGGNGHYVLTFEDMWTIEEPWLDSPGVSNIRGVQFFDVNGDQKDDVVILYSDGTTFYNINATGGLAEFADAALTWSFAMDRFSKILLGNFSSLFPSQLCGLSVDGSSLDIYGDHGAKLYSIASADLGGHKIVDAALVRFAGSEYDGVVCFLDNETAVLLGTPWVKAFRSADGIFFAGDFDKNGEVETVQGAIVLRTVQSIFALITSTLNHQPTPGAATSYFILDANFDQIPDVLLLSDWTVIVLPHARVFPQHVSGQAYYTVEFTTASTGSYSLASFTPSGSSAAIREVHVYQGGQFLGHLNAAFIWQIDGAFYLLVPAGATVQVVFDQAEVQDDWDLWLWVILIAAVSAGGVLVVGMLLRRNKRVQPVRVQDINALVKLLPTSTAGKDTIPPASPKPDPGDKAVPPPDSGSTPQPPPS